MSPTYTLHQLVVSPTHWDQLLQRIQLAWQPGDQLLLLAEAAQGYADPRLLSFNPVTILALDLACLPDEALPEHIQCLSTEQWGELILQHQRHITWR